MVGDLKYGRTVHSLARLLARYEGGELHFVSPASLALPAYVRDDVAAAGNAPQALRASARAMRRRWPWRRRRPRLEVEV